MVDRSQSLWWQNRPLSPCASSPDLCHPTGISWWAKWNSVQDGSGQTLRQEYIPTHLGHFSGCCLGLAPATLPGSVSQSWFSCSSLLNFQWFIMTPSVSAICCGYHPIRFLDASAESAWFHVIICPSSNIIWWMVFQYFPFLVYLSWKDVCPRAALGIKVGWHRWRRFLRATAGSDKHLAVCQCPEVQWASGMWWVLTVIQNSFLNLMSIDRWMDKDG